MKIKAELVRNLPYGFYKQSFSDPTERWLVLVGGTAAANVVVTALTRKGAVRKFRRWQRGQKSERYPLAAPDTEEG